jgi:hypothetical protein
MVDVLRDIPLVEDVLDPPLAAWVIDTNQSQRTRCSSVVKRSTEGAFGPLIGHLLLLCRKGRIATMAITVSEETVGARSSGTALRLLREVVKPSSAQFLVNPVALIKWKALW